MSRVRALERTFLANAITEAARLGVDAVGYDDAVLERLELGALRYGGDAFLERDNLVELLEETPDVAGYALLELQRLGARERLDGDVAQALLKAAVHGAIADHYARQARRLRDGGRA